MLPRVLATLALASTPAAGQDLDPLGLPRELLRHGPSRASAADGPGQLLRSLTASNTSLDVCGLSHDGEHLLVTTPYDGQALIYFLDDQTGAVVKTVSTPSDRDCGLAWDDKRDRFVTADAWLDEIRVLDSSGNPVHVWFITGGVSGAAYDCRRDVYWIVDWEQRTLYSVDPDTGAVLVTYDASPASSSPGGAAYDALRDVVYVGGRNQTQIRAFDPDTGQPGCVFPAQSSFFGPLGLGASRSGSLWHSDYFSPEIYDVEACDPPHPRLDMRPNTPAPGQGFTLTLSGLPPGARAVFGYSTTGCGPTSSSFGTLLLSPPIQVLDVVPAVNGVARIRVPADLAGGFSGPIWLHAGDLLSGQRSGPLAFLQN